MISKNLIYDKILPLVKDKGRLLDYYLIKSLFGNKDIEIINELKKFQNKDGGFGHGLEPDVRMPNSSVVATNVAIKALDFVKDKKLKEPMIKDIVSYLESVYDPKRKGFNMVSKEVDDYPHAVWWNYQDLEKNFPYGNPDPEVVGFLYKNRKHLKTLNISSLINSVIKHVISDNFKTGGMHQLMSVLYFYKRVDQDVKNLIHDRLHEVVSHEFDESTGEWQYYGLEPYKIYVIEPHFLNAHLEELGRNLSYNLEKVSTLTVKPNWKWDQYDDVFEEIKHEWTGHLYFDLLYAFRLHRII